MFFLLKHVICKVIELQFSSNLGSYIAILYPAARVFGVFLSGVSMQKWRATTVRVCKHDFQALISNLDKNYRNSFVGLRIMTTFFVREKSDFSSKQLPSGVSG